jgi:tRNA/rRNA methyltransferase
MPLGNVRIVLVRPKSSGNVGAVARAMKNTGLRDLVLVAPRGFRRRSAAAMAVHADDVLDATRTERTLHAAVADCGWVLGTTCRAGGYRRRPRTPREVAAELVSVAGTNRVALVFGPEDHGLSNEELKLCHELVTIPTHSSYRSLNLAQAVLVVAYELFLAAHAPGADAAPLATSARMELLYENLRAALLEIGFLHGANPDHILFAVRRIFGRARLDDRDVAILLGVARQIRWFAAGGREVAAAKRRRGEPLK